MCFFGALLKKSNEELGFGIPQPRRGTGRIVLNTGPCKGSIRVQYYRGLNDENRVPLGGIIGNPKE